MDLFYKSVTEIFHYIIQFATILIEFVSVCVLIFTVLKAIVCIFRRKDHIRLEIAEGIALALEFKMGAELLRTFIIQDLYELLILGSIILLCAALTFLIQWEIKIEKKEKALKEESIHKIETENK